MNIKRQAQIFITFLVLLISAILTSSYLYQQDKIFLEHSKKSSQNIKNMLEMTLKDLEHFYAYRAYANLRSEGIKAAMLAGDTQKLYALTLPRYRTLREENNELLVMQFHAPDGRSLLRMHRKESFGDDIASRRPMVKKTHQTRMMQSGFEGGREGIAYRIVVPFLEKSHYIGALEFGIDPEYITEKLTAATKMNTLFLFHESRMAAADEEKYPIVYHGYRVPHIDSFYQPILKAYVKDNPEFNQRIVEHDKKNYEVIDIHLMDQYGQPIGLLLCFNDVTRGFDEIAQIVLGSLVVTLVMIIVLLGIIEYVFSRMMKKVTFQEQYLSTVMNAQKNIILVTDGKKIIYVNNAFLEYLHYRTIDEFRQHHKCICELFETGDGESYLQPMMEGMTWSEYVQLHIGREHKAKMTILGKTSLFTVHVQMIDFEKEHHYVAVFTDITDLNNLATLDKLTQIPNRLEFDKMLGYTIGIARRSDRPLSLLLLDIDHFKHINDRFGHLIGDEILKSFSRVLRQHIRLTDTVARWGGEEFIVLLPDTSLSSAIKVADALRQKIEIHSFETVGNITCSIGVAQFNPVEEADDFLHRADEKLYQAKNSGRNRVIA